MSNFLNSYYSNLNDLISINATDITTESLTTKKLVVNGDVDLSGSIINGANSLTFNQPNELTVVEKNFKISGMGYILYQGTLYNIGQLLAAFSGTGQISPYPSITYDSGLNLTSFTGGMSFPSQSISSASINNSDFVTKSTNESLSSIKTWSGTQIFSSIQLNDNLIVDGGGTTVLNSNLKNVNFLSGLTSNLNTRLNTDESNISAVQTKTTNMTFGSNITTFSGTMVFPTASISFNAIVGIACTLGQNQTITSTKSFSAVQNFTSNLRLDGSLLIGTAGSVILTNATLQKIAFISDVTSAVGANLTSLQNQINNINTDYVTESELSTALSPLQNKTQYITASSLNTNISNNTNVDDLFISSTINGFSKGSLNNVITQCASLTSNCQQQITDAQNTANSGVSKADSAQNTANVAKTNADNAQTTANSAFALAGVAQGTATGAGALAALAQTTANGAAAGVTTLGTQVDGIETDVTELQIKCTQLSYNPLTSRTTISQTLNSPFLEIGNLTSGFTQTATDQITLAGLLRCNNRVEINNTLELVNGNSIILEGIINQDNPDAGTNQFLSPITMSGNATLSGASTTISSASTQIGVNSTSNFNCNSTASFGGDISMLASKNLRLKNIVPLLGDDIYFGEGQFNIADDVVFNMKMIANQPVNINNTFQVGTTLNRNTTTTYSTTSLIDANTGMTLTAPSIFITTPLITIGQAGVTSITLNGSIVNIGQYGGFNYLFGTTFVQNLYSSNGILGMAGQVFQQF